VRRLRLKTLRERSLRQPGCPGPPPPPFGGPRRGRADRGPVALRPSASGGRTPIPWGNAVSRVSPFRRSYSVVRCHCSRGPRAPSQGPAFPVPGPETPRIISPPPSARKRWAEDSPIGSLQQPGGRSASAVDPWLCVPQPPTVGGASTPPQDLCRPGGATRRHGFPCLALSETYSGCPGSGLEAWPRFPSAAASASITRPSPPCGLQTGKRPSILRDGTSLAQSGWLSLRLQSGTGDGLCQARGPSLIYFLNVPSRLLLHDVKLDEAPARIGQRNPSRNAAPRAAA
jgi:hypothetical protein